MTVKCKAKNPETCRYHSEKNILTELREQANLAAEAGNTNEYLKLKEQADFIEDRFAEAEQKSLEDSERNLKINGNTNENETTNRIREAETAAYVIEQAFLDYNANSYEDKKEALKAQLLINNNKTITTALFDLEGNRIHAKLIPVNSFFAPGGKEYIWGILETADPNSRVTDWFRPSKAKNEKTEKNNNAKKGYYIGKVLHPATIKKMTHSTLAGSNSWPEIVPRWDVPLDSNEIEILDNGQN